MIAIPYSDSTWQLAKGTEETSTEDYNTTQSRLKDSQRCVH